LVDAALVVNEMPHALPLDLAIVVSRLVWPKDPVSR
jgi:hypothetical protein